MTDLNLRATEQLIQYLKRNANTEYAHLINTIKRDYPALINADYQNILGYLSHENLINEVRLGSGLYFSLTDSGQKLKEFKTLNAYHGWLKAEQLAKDEIAHLTTQKLRYEVKNARRIFKTYWWTFAIAVLSGIISLSLAILKISELMHRK